MRARDTLAVLWYGFLLDASEAQALGEQLLAEATPENQALWQDEWTEALYAEGLSDPGGEMWAVGVNLATVDGEEVNGDVPVEKLTNEALTEMREFQMQGMSGPLRSIAFDKDWRLRLSCEVYAD